MTLDPTAQGRREVVPSVLGERLEAASGAAPLSYGQQALLFFQRRQPESTAYNTRLVVTVPEPANSEVMRACFDGLVRRHQILRTVYPLSGDSQVITENASCDFDAVDAGSWSEVELSEWVDRESTHLFDLVNGPVMRVRLLERGAESRLLICAHHIAIDYWSFGILLDDLAALYPALAAGRTPNLAPLTDTYAGYARRQRRYTQTEQAGKCLEFWRKQIAGEFSGINLSLDKPRPATQAYRGATHEFRIPTALVEQATAIAKQENTTLYAFCLAAFSVLLHRYSGQERIVIGTPSASRKSTALEHVVGYFVNLLPLVSDGSNEPAFRDFLRRVSHTVIDAVDHEDYPFPLLIEQLGAPRHPNRAPLCDAVCSWDKRPETAAADAAGFRVLSVGQHGGPFDLTFIIFERESGLAVSIQHDTDLFEAASIEQFARNYLALVQQIVANPDTRISRFSLSDPGFLRVWSGEPSAYPRDSRIEELFAEQVQLNPSAIAIGQGSQALTYTQLDARSGEFARMLAEHDVEAGEFVAVMMERSIDQIAAILGILKAGCVYLPLESSYPAERLAFLLRDAGVRFVFEQSGELIPVQEAVAQQTGPRSRTASDPAYVMYTSGSTGEPKGVVVPHRAVVRLVRNTNFMEFGPNETFLHMAPVSFDAATLEIWGPLLNGGRLVLAPAGTTSLSDIGRIIRDHRVTSAWLTAGLFHLMVEQRLDDLKGLQQLVAGGDILSPAHVRQALERLPGCTLINGYGPTENTTFTCCHRITREDVERRSIPIGRPIANTFVYVLDEALQPVGVGIPGELWMGGDGVALGYWNRPELTRERFLDDPFHPGGRMYRSGDRVRWLANGSIEFLGRIDEQVKIRGFRIEPGEIEAALREHAAVADCVVCAREAGGGKRLVAWAARRAGRQVSGGELRDFLKIRLPDYMVPSACVVVDTLPLNANGKIDRRALPDPETVAGTAAQKTALTPNSELRASGRRAELERKIAAIWAKGLGVASVARDGNFFEMGGHSLLLIRVHAELERELKDELGGRELKIVDLFRYPTVRALAGLIAGAEPEPVIEAGPPARLPSEPVAIVSMTGRFPGAASVEELWQRLRAGEELIRRFTDEELKAAGVAEEEFGAANYVKAGTLLEGAEMFDARYFGFNPREAEITDPQHRLFLECAHEALERAGYDPARYAGRIGVFAGSTVSSYWTEKLLRNRAVAESVGPLQMLIGNDKDFVPTRVAYKLNLRGPAVNVQTACSTSLVAVHLACESLRTGACEMALAGGVSIRFPQPQGYPYQAESILSPDGHCRPFDEEAAGTVAGNGVGVVLLKRLADAERDRDRIEAVILGSAINNDGANKVGYTAPGVEGQAAVIRAALESAGVEPETVTAIEAHGTGTKLGDPIEVAALQQAYGRGEACALASLKGSLGHLDAAAGVTGLIKAALELGHGELVGMPHFAQAAAKLGLKESRFYVPRGVERWERKGGRRRIGVSSFGIGGTNAHVIVEEAPPRQQEQARPGREWELLTLSAKTATALETASERLAGYLEAQPEASLADVAYTLQVGRTAHAHRRAVLCRSAEDAAKALRGMDPEKVRSGVAEQTGRPVVFMFPGGGTQFPGMGRDLYESEPLFRAEVDRCAELLKAEMGVDIRNWMYAPADSDDAVREMRKTRIGLPALFVTEYANARLFMSWGIQPTAMIGHSLGEYVCSCLAGVLSLEDSLRLVAARSRLMNTLPPGSMLVVYLAESEVRKHLDENVAIAAINAPELCVVSGEASAIQRVEEKVGSFGIEVQRLHIDVASHSPVVDSIVHEFGVVVRNFPTRAPEIPYVSNLTGTWITPEDVANTGYWPKHLRNPVRFADGLAQVLQNTSAILVEVGPGRTLTSLVGRHPARIPAHTTVSTLRHPHDPAGDVAFSMAALSQLWTSGADVNWTALHAGESRRRSTLPTYPFERERFSVAATSEQKSAFASKARRALAEFFYVPVWKQHVRPRQKPVCAACEWLIFMDEHGVAERVAQAIESGGGAVTRVLPGDGFRIKSHRTYRIRIDSPADYAELISALRATPANVANFFGITRDRVPVAETKARSFYSLLYLAQTLGERSSAEAVTIHSISNGACAFLPDEVCWPEKAIAFGPCRVMPEEYPDFRCQAIDLPAQWTDRDLDALVHVLRTDPSPDLVALRRGEIWTQAYEPVRLEGSDGSAPEDSGSTLRRGGVYVLSGGTGGIGLEIAGDLARTLAANVALVSRSGAPGRDQWESILASGETSREATLIRKLAEIESSGAELMIVRADTADADQFEAALRAVEQRFGEIDGIIHAAGVAGEGLTQMKTPELAEPVLRPKVDAIFALEKVLENRSPAFVVLCSSLSSVLGGAGHVDYAAANAAIDAFAQARRGASGPFVAAINWNTWKDVGMAARVQLPQALAAWKESVHGTGISREEGIEAFRRIVASGLPQVAVSTVDLTDMLAGHASFTPRSPAPETAGETPREGHARLHIGVAYVAPRNETETAIANLWSEMLGLEKTGIHDNFFSLGGHSLLGARMLARLPGMFGVTVPLKRLFASPTPAGLAQEVADAIRARDEKETAALLAVVERLGEDEVEMELRKHAAAGRVN